MLKIKNIESFDKDFITALNIFVEDFNHYNKEEKELSIYEEVIIKNFSLNEKAIIAAVVESLANDNGLKVPEWVNKAEYFLDIPYYQLNTTNKNYQKYLIDVSPNEFKKRKLFFEKESFYKI